MPNQVSAFLSHGSLFPIAVGEQLLPFPATNWRGEQGRFLFASNYRNVARAYPLGKLTKHLFFGMSPLAREPGVNAVLPVSYTKLCPEDPFAPIRDLPATLATVSSDGFVPVPSETPHPHDEIEWVSSAPARILSVETYVLDDVVRTGLQLFSLRIRMRTRSRF